MGDYTKVEGVVHIDPPLTYAEIKDSPFYPDGAHYDSDANVILDVQKSTHETGEGQLTRFTCEEIIPYTEERRKFYRLVEDLIKLVDAFPGHRFHGRFDCEAESWELGGIYLVIVEDVGDHHEVRKLAPTLTWPDGVSAHNQQRSREALIKAGFDV